MSKNFSLIATSNFLKISNRGQFGGRQCWSFLAILAYSNVPKIQFSSICFFSDLKRTTKSCEKKILAINPLLIRYFCFLFSLNWLHWADSVIELPCPDVCLSVCVFVNLDPPNYFFKTSYKHFFGRKKNVTPNKNL